MQPSGKIVQNLNERFNRQKTGLNIKINMDFAKFCLGLSTKVTAKMLLTRSKCQKS